MASNGSDRGDGRFANDGKPRRGSSVESRSTDDVSLRTSFVANPRFMDDSMGDRGVWAWFRSQLSGTPTDEEKAQLRGRAKEALIIFTSLLREDEMSRGVKKTRAKAHRARYLFADFRIKVDEMLDIFDIRFYPDGSPPVEEIVTVFDMLFLQLVVIVLWNEGELGNIREAMDLFRRVDPLQGRHIDWVTAVLESLDQEEQPEPIFLEGAEHLQLQPDEDWHTTLQPGLNSSKKPRRNPDWIWSSVVKKTVGTGKKRTRTRATTKPSITPNRGMEPGGFPPVRPRQQSQASTIVSPTPSTSSSRGSARSRTSRARSRTTSS